MARTTGIEWTDATLNPFVGCSRVSPGCVNCYAIPIAHRNGSFGTPQYQGATKKDERGRLHWTGAIQMAAGWKKKLASFSKDGQLVFVNSMSDFWHENATADMRREVLDEMRKYPHHGFQVLTKRPENIAPALDELGQTLPDNFWLGATVEDQQRADERIPDLVAIPARVRFLSVEPLLEEVNLVGLLKGIHWVIVGGESGPGARPMKADWVRILRDQCEEAGVPMFFKQYGTWRNNPLALEVPRHEAPATWVEKMDPVGKGGSKLDGREVKQLPLEWTASGRGVSPANGSLPWA